MHKLHGVTCRKIVVLIFADIINSRLLSLYAIIVPFVLHMHILGLFIFQKMQGKRKENTRKTQET